MNYEVNKAYKEFKDYRLHDKCDNMSFEEFTNFVSKDDSFNKTSEVFFNLFNKTYNQKILKKKCISSFIFYKYSKESLLGDNNQLESTLLVCAEILSKSISEENMNYENIIENYENYIKIFIIWQQKDRESMLEIMSSMHNKFKFISNTTESTDIKNTTENHLNTLKKTAHILGGTTAVDKISSEDNSKIIDNKHLIDQIDNQIKQNFWDNFKRDLCETPPNFTQYISLLNEIKFRCIDIVSDTSREIETKKLLETNLDETLITDKIKNNNYNLPDIIDSCFFCLDTLKKIGNVENNKLVDFYRDSVNVKIKETDVDTSDIISNVFKFTLEQLDNIINLKTMSK